MTDKNNTPAEIKEKTTTTAKKQNKLGRYILRHKVTFSLIFALVVVFIWAQCSISKLNKANKALTVAYEAKMDSAKVDHYKAVSGVFSWAVRSDLMRNNIDQAAQYINNITKEPYILKAYIVDTDKNSILTSSNPAENGLPVSDITLLRATQSVTQLNDSITRFTSPITGLSTIIGVSVLEANFKR